MAVWLEQWGGAPDRSRQKPPIGGSCTAIRCDDSLLLIDFGAYPKSPAERKKDAERVLSTKKPELEYRSLAGRMVPILPETPDFNNILPDSDMVPAAAESIMPNIGDIKGVKNVYAIITHGHNDHVGMIPALHRIFSGKNLEIIMTAPTRDIWEWLWEDYLKIARRAGWSPAFTFSDVQATRKFIRIVEDGANLNLGPFNVRRLPRAGHLLGGVSVHVEVEGVKIFHTGDYSTLDQLVTPGAELVGTETLGGVDFLISESTYAASRRKWSRARDIRRFVAYVRSVLDRGGKVLLPALAVGRSQELYAILKRKGVVDEYPVWLDGSAQDISRIYCRYGAVNSDILEHCVMHGGERDSIMASEEPLVMIAPAGMLSGGWAVAYVTAWASSPLNAIALTCYQHPSTPGYRLLRMKCGESFWLGEGDRAKKVTLRAEVSQTHLSAHMSGGELADLIDRLKPRKTFLVHGERRQIAKAEARLGSSVRGLWLGERIELLNNS